MSSILCFSLPFLIYLAFISFPSTHLSITYLLTCLIISLLSLCLSSTHLLLIFYLSSISSLFIPRSSVSSSGILCFPFLVSGCFHLSSPYL
ncbi:uncharacterized protein BJX67DRAFT_359762 [Aspergillus lucknowensis]|uniref:Uncharacterized protein n=1 Tax=Aspergillus lucknowensis TaxID=176173 RepID=A0ABR4LKK6_9EURO